MQESQNSVRKEGTVFFHICPEKQKLFKTLENKHIAS